MHLFQFTTLFYLSFHVLAYAFLFASIMGIPGMPDETKPMVKVLLSVWNIFLLMAWKGIPALAIVSLIAFFFNYETLAKIACGISLGIGTVLFLTVVAYYTIQSKK